MEMLRLKNQVLHVDVGKLAILTNFLIGLCLVKVSNIVVQVNGNLDIIILRLLTTFGSCALFDTILRVRHVRMLSWRQ